MSSRSKASLLPRIARLVIVGTICLSLGLHWALLQGVAWAGMLVSFASEGTVIEAVQKTFDGQHGCPLCKKVKEGRSSNRKQPQQAGQSVQKINAVLAEVNTFATEVHGKIEEFVAERDTAWLTSDYSSAVERWQTAWKNIDTGAVPGPGRLEIETVDEENEGILDKIGDAPASP